MKENVRENWVDKAKFIGIMLMLLGHNAIANKEVFDFIYSFHMPLFFIISGYFASNKKECFRGYLSKSVKRLLLPYLFFYILTLPFGYLVIYSNPIAHPVDGWMDFLIKPLIGMFTVERTSFAFHTNGPSWFFIALFIVRLIFYIPKRFNCSSQSLLTTSLCVLCVYFTIKWFGINPWCRIDVALMAFPLYVGGYLFRNKTNFIPKLEQFSNIKKISLSLVLFVVCYFLGSINGHVEFSAAHYGNYYLLMLFVAFIGTFATIAFSFVLPDWKYILTLGGGTAVVLGLHSPIQTFVKEITAILWGIPTENYTLLVAIPMVIVISLIHIPIIKFLNAKLPFFIGR